MPSWRRADVNATAGAPDPASASAPGGLAGASEPPVLPHRRLVLLACILAMFMGAIEATIVATAMPTIVAHLGGFPLLGWVFSIYLLTQAITIPIYGRLADLYGRKRVFFVGAGIFLLGSVLCGFATSMGMLVAFRALQGIGAGAIMPVASTIVGDIYSPQERAKVQGYLSSVWGISAIAGPLLGAFLVQHASWTLVFWVNVPVGLASMLLLARFLPERRVPTRQRLDVVGTTLLTTAVALLLVVLLQAESLGSGLWPLLALAVGAAALLVWQQRRAADPLFPLALWRSPLVVAGNVGGVVIGAAMMGISAFLPTYLQGVSGHDPLAAGVTLAMMSIGWPLASTLSGRMMLRTSYRHTAVLGGVLLVAGACMLPFLSPERDLVWARVGAFLVGAGMGMCNTTFLVSVQNAADREMRGIATASTIFTRILGSALGVAVLGAVLNHQLLRSLPAVQDPVQRLMDPALRLALPPVELAVIVQGVSGALHQVFWVGCAMAALALIIGWLIPAGVRPGHVPASMMARSAPPR